jgi:phage shock protein C
MKRSEISHRGLYRSRQGAILGVCRGIAHYFDFSVFWTRTIAVLLLIFTGFWPVLIIYLGAALLMRPEPVLSIHSEDEREFYDSYTHSRRGAADRLKRKFNQLDRRIQRMEHAVTSREYDWEQRLNK